MQSPRGLVVPAALSTAAHVAISSSITHAHMARRIPSTLLPLLPRPLPRSMEHACIYLPGRVAQQEYFSTPGLPPADFEQLLNRGFRRVGTVLYAPRCPACTACVPLRVPVAAFVPSRSQRRVARRNADIDMLVRTPECTLETHALYRRYLASQHTPWEQRSDGDAAAESGSTADDAPQSSRNAASLQDDFDSFRSSLYTSCVDTLEAVYSVAGKVVAISILDLSPTMLSAVYHFFDPAMAKRSLGVFSVLAEIELARWLGKTHYTLGFWIAEAQSMRYKGDYRPNELLVNGTWVSGGR